MISASSVYRLSIDSPTVNETAANFRLPSWPPPREFPVVIDEHGIVVSRYGDAVWDLSVWAKVPKFINFGDGQQREYYGKVSTVNADTFRMVVAWWLWGPRNVMAAGTLVSQHRALKCIFVVCTTHGVDARTLSRYPSLIAEIAAAIAPSARLNALSLLHCLLEQKSQLGFTILDRDALRQLATHIPSNKDFEQTAYIPPRIWGYQVHRLSTALDDFNQHRDNIQACYHFVLHRYETNYGSLYAALRNPNRKKLAEGIGTFEQISKDFGVYDLLCRWYQRTRGRQTLPLSALSNYLALINKVGLAYLLNFSLMRVQEAWDLRVDCLHVERDDKLGEITTLRGETTKTILDDDARWITSPSVAKAVDAMAAISAWRLNVKQAYGVTSANGAPFLYQPTCEPWKFPLDPRPTRGMYPTYSDVAQDHPKLFEESELTVTQEDWNLAKLITPTLDHETFGVGRPWRFAWHQLRRTGSVNMQASGLVSDFSLQYQLKHETVASSLYYGQGYSHLAFNRSARAEYIRAMYEMMGRDLAMLLTDRFVSPYGEDRKRTILKIVSEGADKKLVTAAMAGRVAWRRTLLGGCTKNGPCEFGGVDNVVRCGGGDDKRPCADALFDRERLPALERLGASISIMLQQAEAGSPYQLSLQAQLRATENAQNVINEQP